jgi:hypothetical protein
VYLQNTDKSSPSWAVYIIPNMGISLHPHHGHFTSMSYSYAQTTK